MDFRVWNLEYGILKIRKKIKIDTQIHTQKKIFFLFQIIFFEICKRFAKYSNSNSKLKYSKI